jgi:hypothetical protein
MTKEELANNWDLYFSNNKPNQFIALLNFYRFQKNTHELFWEKNESKQFIFLKPLLEKWKSIPPIADRKTINLFSFSENSDELDSKYMLIYEYGMVSLIANAMANELSVFQYCYLDLNQIEDPSNACNLHGYSIIPLLNFVIRKQYYEILLKSNKLPEELI